MAIFCIILYNEIPVIIDMRLNINEEIVVNVKITLNTC